MKKIVILILTLITFSCRSQNEVIKPDSLKKIIIILDNKSNFKHFIAKNDSINLNTFHLSWPSVANFKENEFVFDENNKIISTHINIKGRNHKLSMRSEEGLIINKTDLDTDFIKIFLSDFVYFKHENLLRGLKSFGNIIYVTTDISNIDEINIKKCSLIE